MAKAANRCLVFLDACRDNPFVSLTPIAQPPSLAKRVAGLTDAPIAAFLSRGLAPVDVAPETQAFIGFAAEPGKFAYGSTGTYSRFTEAFLENIDTEDLNVLMRRIGADVKSATSNAQRPWSQSNLIDDFFFRPASWQPVYIMAELGALSGLVTSHFAFNDDARFADAPYAGTIFAAVVAYGVWRWGRRSFLSAGIAFLVATLSWMAGTYVLRNFGTLSDYSHVYTCRFYKTRRCCGISSGRRLRDSL